MEIHNCIPIIRKLKKQEEQSLEEKEKQQQPPTFPIKEIKKNEFIISDNSAFVKLNKKF